MFVLLLQVCALAAWLHGATAQTLPNISLPWGTWQSQVYSDDQVYVFSNVRFGDVPPLFNKASFPSYLNSSVQDSTYGPACYQVKIPQCKNQDRAPPEVLLPSDDTVQDRDCLFLDIYVPKSVFGSNGQPTKKVPVVVWFYGGAYAIGSKNLAPNIPLYTGEAVLSTSVYDTIFVVGNYRLGAFGFLAGNYMEGLAKNGQAQTNAGLYDQALLLQWVQDYISLVGGDPTQVSAWGESAGASSVLHHLVRGGGAVDPLFNSFFVMSPAYQWSWENAQGGKLDNFFNEFAASANCTDFNITCLQGKDMNSLVTANQDFICSTYDATSQFAVGPAVDGNWIQKLPTLSLTSGEVWPGIKNAIISHVGDESKIFTPPVTNQTGFCAFLNNFFPGQALANVRGNISSVYNCPTNYNNDWQACLGQVIADSSFLCNTRLLFDAYPPSTGRYMLQYDFPNTTAAYHATDLLPAFMNSEDDAFNMMLFARPNMTTKQKIEAHVAANLLNTLIKPKYHNYIASFALSGNPNTLGGPQWPNATVDGSGVLQGVMTVSGIQGLFQAGPDSTNTQNICGFWTKIAAMVAAAPPVARTPAETGHFLKQQQPARLHEEELVAEEKKGKEMLDVDRLEL